MNVEEEMGGRKEKSVLGESWGAEDEGHGEEGCAVKKRKTAEKGSKDGEKKE